MWDDICGEETNCETAGVGCAIGGIGLSSRRHAYCRWGFQNLELLRRETIPEARTARYFYYGFQRPLDPSLLCHAGQRYGSYIRKALITVGMALITASTALAENNEVCRGAQIAWL